MEYREARNADIGLLSAVYTGAVCQCGFGPIVDLDAVITASITGKPLIVPSDILFAVDSAEFKIDVIIGETATREFAGFYICRTIAKDGKPAESSAPNGVQTELWYVAVAPNLRKCGIGRKLVHDSLVVLRSRTRGRGGMLARVTGRNGAITRILTSEGFCPVLTHYDVTQVWLHPESDEEDQFADIVVRD